MVQIGESERALQNRVIYPFFSTVQIAAAGNDSEGLRYGVINTPEKFYLEWKNYPKTSETKAKEINNICTQIENNKLEWQIYSIYEKIRFLDIVHNFIIFDKGIKKICRHNQYFGILEALQKISRREGGIIWHTQGSGKSLTIAYKNMLDQYLDLLKKAENPEVNEYFPLSVRQSAAKRAFYTQFGENDELANELYDAVLNSKQDGFRGNIVKIRIIKKALYRILNNDSEVEKAYELVNVQNEF